jgi:formate hydrogenlyase subunit 4
MQSSSFKRPARFVSGLELRKDSVLTLFLLAGYPLLWLLSGLVLFWPLHVSYWKGVLVSIMHNIITVVVAGVVGGLALAVLAVIQLVSA